MCREIPDKESPFLLTPYRFSMLNIDIYHIKEVRHFTWIEREREKIM